MSERCEIMGRIAVAIRENAQELGRLENIDHGFPILKMPTISVLERHARLNG